jgi:hypothetical protein
MQLTFSLTLPDALYQDLIADCQECECSPKQWAAEAVESVIASRLRLPHVFTPALTQGPRMRGTSNGAEQEDEREFEDAESAGLKIHRILL